MTKQPCPRHCPRREPGCGVTCPDWQAYIKARNADYAVRAKYNKANGDYLGTSWVTKTPRQKINIWHTDNRRKHRRKGS